jgi:hypothetical protein
VAGDFGAPLESAEILTIESNMDRILPELSKESQQKIENLGFHQWESEINSATTVLHDDGACVFMVRDESGIATCGIEKTYETGAIDFIKPISCHLYPIRVKKNRASGFEALNYDHWDICQPACSLGQALKMPLYQFVKDGLCRLYGTDFYDQLENAVKHAENG